MTSESKSDDCTSTKPLISSDIDFVSNTRHTPLTPLLASLTSILTKGVNLAIVYFLRLLVTFLAFCGVSSRTFKSLEG